MRSRILTVVVAMLASLLWPAQVTAAPPDWLETRTTWKAPGNNDVKVVGLRYAAHPRFDRVVIDLRGPLPDHRTGYVERFTYDGSGDPIPIRGRAGLWIGLQAAGHTIDGDSLYTGPRLARPRFDSLKALALAGDWEGQVTFFFALRHRAAYRVLHLADPSRMVIDFQHR